MGRDSEGSRKELRKNFKENDVEMIGSNFRKPIGGKRIIKLIMEDI